MASGRHAEHLNLNALKAAEEGTQNSLLYSGIFLGKAGGVASLRTEPDTGDGPHMPHLNSE